ncbi:MAG: hypothetical protein RBT69_12895 [Spirochaetia bacterium]|jgi:heptaprenyl diphosphate synthase|nr:hypothetical protein [Spirochaetia bacterium]
MIKLPNIFKKILPKTYFYTGLSVMVPFLFTENIAIRFLFTAFIIIMNLFSGRNFRLLPNLILTAGVILANIYPFGGRVIFTIGPLFITQEALISGIEKSLLLIGSVYISRFAVRKQLVFPGKTGLLLYKTFYYFEKFTEMKLNVKSDIIGQIDTRLIEIEGLSAKEDVSSVSSFSAKSGMVNHLFFILVSLFFWVLFIASKFYLGRS